MQSPRLPSSMGYHGVGQVGVRARDFWAKKDAYIGIHCVAAPTIECKMGTKLASNLHLCRHIPSSMLPSLSPLRCHIVTSSTACEVAFWSHFGTRTRCRVTWDGVILCVV